MIKLIAMSQVDFDEYIQQSLLEFTDEQVKEGNWIQEEAPEKAKNLFEQLLPDGVNSDGHFFYYIQDDRLNEQVGILWIADTVIQGKRMLFIFDIRVFPEYRRRGYASQALKQVEMLAGEMDIPTVGLHVFKHNLPARALYEKLGFVDVGENMVKEI